MGPVEGESRNGRRGCSIDSISAPQAEERPRRRAYNGTMYCSTMRIGCTTIATLKKQRVPGRPSWLDKLTPSSHCPETFPFPDEQVHPHSPHLDSHACRQIDFRNEHNMWTSPYCSRSETPSADTVVEIYIPEISRPRSPVAGQATAWLGHYLIVVVVMPDPRTVRGQHLSQRDSSKSSASKTMFLPQDSG